jgi:hypothetical protein
MGSYSTYESAGRYFVKFEGKDERQITKLEYLQLRELKSIDFQKNIDNFKKQKREQ